MRANPITDAVCLEGLPRVARSLRRAWTDGKDLEARTDMSVAALCGGLALANAGLGAVHGFAAAVGGRFDAPHGAVCAALLPGAVRANVAALTARAAGSPVLARYVTVARIVTGRAEATAGDLVEWLLRLREDLRIPGLRGTSRGQQRRAALRDAARASSMRANPIVSNPKSCTRCWNLRCNFRLKAEATSGRPVPPEGGFFRLKAEATSSRARRR